MDMNRNSELAVPQKYLGSGTAAVGEQTMGTNYSSAYAICRTIDCAASVARYLLLQKKITITPEEAKKHIWIEFEGAMHLADVWINGKHVMQHAGGYTHLW